MEIPTRLIEKAKFVTVIFTNVEKEYDALLHLMTFGFDWVWRRRMLSKIDFSHEIKVLDLACGTGLVTFELCRLVAANGFVVGLDLSPAMLQIARRKAHRLSLNCPIGFVRAAGEFLPFRSDSFSYVTVGLALRNFGDKLAVFHETRRVLSGFGLFLSVDFVLPENSLVRRLHLFHVFHVLPTLGGLVSNNWHRTLTYLANSIQVSISSDEIRRMLTAAGFRRAFSEKMSLGIVALVGGQK
jgi:ubiquinone/menaquinone biosynthesis methyltransferase